MQPSDLYKFLTEKGYTHSNIYHIPRGERQDVYAKPEVWSIGVFRDIHKEDGGYRKWFDAPTITELFYLIQAELPNAV